MTAPHRTGDKVEVKDAGDDNTFPHYTPERIKNRKIIRHGT